MFEFVMRKSGYNFDEEVFLVFPLDFLSILIYRINLWMYSRERERVAFQLDEWNIKCEFLMLTLTLA